MSRNEGGGRLCEAGHLRLQAMRGRRIVASSRQQQIYADGRAKSSDMSGTGHLVCLGSQNDAPFTASGPGAPRWAFDETGEQGSTPGTLGNRACERGLEHVRLRGGVLERDEARALRFGRPHRPVDLRCRPSGHARLRRTAALGERTAGLRGGLAPALIRAERGQPGLLLVIQEAVEVLQRRLHGADRRGRRLK